MIFLRTTDTTDTTDTTIWKPSFDKKRFCVYSKKSAGHGQTGNMLFHYSRNHIPQSGFVTY